MSKTHASLSQEAIFFLVRGEQQWIFGVADQSVFKALFTLQLYTNID